MHAVLNHERGVIRQRGKESMMRGDIRFGCSKSFLESGQRAEKKEEDSTIDMEMLIHALHKDMKTCLALRFATSLQTGLSRFDTSRKSKA